MVTLRRHWRTATLFALLSAADLALTLGLLRQGDGEVYEANRLAAAVLSRYGAVGLAVFKGLFVVLAGCLVGVVAVYRPRAASSLATFACVLVGAVVLHSAALCCRLAAQPPSARGSLAALQQETRRLEAVARTRREFGTLLQRWTDELAAGRCGLPEALNDLLTSPLAREPGFLDSFRAVGGKSDADCLAAVVVNGALLSLREDGSPAALARAERICAAYYAVYDPAILAPLSQRHDDLLAQRAALSSRLTPDGKAHSPKVQ
jgi:hypothetical protein